MRQFYKEKYIQDRQSRESLELLKWFVFEKATDRASLDFAVIFLRIADKCLYHASNTWSQFVSNMNSPEQVLKGLGEDARQATQDRNSKYEIEGYLVAVKSFFEGNVGAIRRKAFESENSPEFNRRLRKLFSSAEKKFDGGASQIRDDSCHVTSSFRDSGVLAWVKKSGNGYAVTLPNIYVDANGIAVDLAEVFVSTHEYISELIVQVRDELLGFFCAQSGPPSNDVCHPIRSPHGNAMVILGPKGFEFTQFAAEANQ